jgi:hypothetical protein
MASYTASIQRSNKKELQQVEVQVTTTESAGGRISWRGEFMARTTDGIMPDERLALTFDTGYNSTARVTETYFDSRKPDNTKVLIAGTSPLV